MNYELKVTETNRKSGKFHYQVIDESGNVISERKSNREYVACTLCGSYFFGRLDLIGKGDYSRCIGYINENLSMTQNKWDENAIKFSNCLIYQRQTYQQFIDYNKNRLHNLTTIIYKNQNPSK